ncbi:VOC family protein [Demequina capsici]|uniref:VOC family protein n=1 Tax=Demequina capsici TaxID=3075620 RepID=A0AA96J7G0_9MICO|nr:MULTISPECIES: VOC family protein [unclassified Demequina]WNM24315.1 VOC family protein [Demequina sp. OYTSA14]WNM27137.1 VOC family protein [Demequina sp. PMTSA13]
MATVSTYLNFDGTCEEAFAFYRTVFGTEFSAPVMRKSAMPAGEGMPPLAPEEAEGVMHVALPILGGHQIMGTDITPSMGHVLKHGNDTSINLECDDLAQLNHLFFALSESAGETFGPMPMPWGQHFATVVDQFGIRWMLVAPLEAAPAAPSA